MSPFKYISVCYFRMRRRSVEYIKLGHGFNVTVSSLCGNLSVPFKSVTGSRVICLFRRAWWPRCCRARETEGGQPSARASPQCGVT